MRFRVNDLLRYTGPFRANEMGRFVVRGLPSEPEGTVDEATGAQVTASDGVGIALDWIWSAISSPRMSQALSGLLLLWCIAVLAIPGSRPGLVADPVSASGRATYAMDLLHPVAGWALRGLLAAIMFVLVLRAARHALPSMDGLVVAKEAVPLSTAEPAIGEGVPETVWRGVLAAFGSQPTVSQSSVAREGLQQVLLYPPLGYRLASQMRTVGLILMIAAVLGIWAEARLVVSPALLLDVETVLPAVDELDPPRVTVHALEVAGAPDKVRATVLCQADGFAPSAIMLTNSRWRMHRGFWVRIGDVVPAVWLRAQSPDGSPLMLQPVVGDRQGITEYRAVLDGNEEQVLTVPDARSVLRITAVAVDTDKDQVVIEVLDGGLGTVMDSLRLPTDTTLRVDGMTLEARMEHAVVLTMWRLPGLPLLILGAIVALAGAALRHVFPPWRAWIGLARAGQTGDWHILLATDPASLADRLASRLSPEPE